jgi:galactonate dehydratase
VPFVAKDGHVELPKGPGLGIELDEDAMRDKLGHSWRTTESHLWSDGSVVNW